MDVFSALQTAVSGLKAQAFSLDNISGNIANSATTGFKRIDTSFVDLVTEQDSAKRQVAGSVAAQSRATNTVQGALTATDTSTNMALNGDGFFVVQAKTGSTGTTPTFSGDLYTRRGDFSVNADGYLVNGAGAYLSGQTLNPASQAVTGTGPIQISNAILPAKATTALTYSANLPKSPKTTNSTSATGSGLLGTFADGSDARVLSGSGTATVSAANAQSFVDSSIAGPSLTTYTAAGEAVTVQARWAKVAEANAAGTTPDTWNLFYADTTSSTGTDTSWKNVGTAFAFNASGQLTATGATQTTIPDLSVNGTVVGNVALNFGSGGLTQYASVNGTSTTNALTQDGYASGTLNSLAVGDDGTIKGTYSNGTTRTLANVGIVRFNNADGLKAEASGNYAQTAESGTALTGLNGTLVVGSNVESSNTDIAAEFSKMIVTQQAYSANTRVMTTAQTMISDLLNVIR